MQEKRSTQVVMGTLRRANSFGEISLLSADPMKCSIVTATSVELGIISPCQMDGTLFNKSHIITFTRCV